MSYLLIMTYAEVESEWQKQALPPLENLLTPAEEAELALLKAENRRESRKTGRKLLRLLLLRNGQNAPADLEILTRNEQGQGVRPRVSCQNVPVPGCFSLTHSDTHVAAGWIKETKFRLGLDFVNLTNLGTNQLDWAFAEPEKKLVKESQNPVLTAGTIWAFKEATYKAANDNVEGFNPQQIVLEQTLSESWTATYRGKHLANAGTWSLHEMQDAILAEVQLASDSF
ncbi:MAG: 4'-phosphopantetheinyl transferase superfamily protein [Planctomycetaceae bacterium]|nr:4'-phosphopantetheinyl transferase superfamily protein [Planctomycetaceae bacterium]